MVDAEIIKNLALTITQNQRQILKTSYAHMEGNSASNGLAIYARLFQEYPEYKGLFPRFRHIHDSVLLTTGEFLTFAQLYMSGLRNIIYSLDDDVGFITSLEKIAMVHKQKAVEPRHLHNMVPMVLATLRQCDVELSEEVEKAWYQLFNIIAQIIELLKKQQKKKP